MSTPSRHNRERSSWALLSILIIVVLFGLFWLWQRTLLSHRNDNFTPLAGARNPNGASAAQTARMPDVTTLEASAVNIPIPDFSSAF